MRSCPGRPRALALAAARPREGERHAAAALLDAARAAVGPRRAEPLAEARGGGDDGGDDDGIVAVVVHAPSDAEVAEKLRDALQAHGQRSVALAGGETRALESARPDEVVVLVLVSKALQTQAEENRALQLARDALHNALLPVVLEESFLRQPRQDWAGQAISDDIAHGRFVDFCDPDTADGAAVAQAVRLHKLQRGCDVFLSHEWGVHAEAKEIAAHLGRDHGLRVWLDDDEQSAAATEAIDRAGVFVVLATARYMTEVNGGDNGCKCYKELVYAGDHCANRMVVAALEPAMLHVAAQKSDGNIFKFNIGRAPVADLTSVDSASVARLARRIEQSKAASSAQDSLPQGMRELYAHLGPVDSTQWAQEKADAFSAGPQQRGFLESIGRWYQSEDRIVVVEGDDNVGKSTALAEVCRRGGAFGDGTSGERHRASVLRKMWRHSGTERPPLPVVAMHFFRREVADESASTALKSLAWQLCFSVPGFVNALDLEQLAHAEDKLTDVFDAALAAPATKVSAPSVRQVVVLDALDACVDAKDLIQKVIVERWVSELPPWLCLAISTRPDPQLVRMLADFQAVVLNERLERSSPKTRVEMAKSLPRVEVGKGIDDGAATTPAVPAAQSGKSRSSMQRRKSIDEALASIRLPAALHVFIIHARADGGAATQLLGVLQPYAHENGVRMSDGSEDGVLSALFEGDPSAKAVVLVLVSEAMQAETQRGKNRAFKEASKLLPTALLPVVVDAKMLTQKSWTGNLSLALGNELYVDFHEPGEADGAMIARSVLNKHEGRRGAHDWDVFISHEWGVHDTAKDLALRLDRDHGLKVWLDEKEMHGKINEAMAEGIGRSKVFLILATARYLEKVNSGSGEENCCKEFTYASAQAQPTVVAALEPAMLRVTSLTADGNTFNVDLGGAPVIDLTSDTEASMRQLVRAIKERQTTTSDDDALPKGLRELRARLDPLDSSRWARRKADAFSPGTRRWILDFVQDWYEKSDERVIVVQGDGGVGKSTVLAELCRRGGALGGDEIAPESQKRISMRQRLSRRSGKGAGPMPVAAIHFFRHDRDAAKSTTTALRSIAWQLCSALPGFAAALEQGLMAKTSDELQALEDVFDTVLAAPAAKVDETHPPRGRHVVVLDALDECGNTAQFIQKIIVQRWTAKLPPWLCLLVSTRPEAQIPELMQGFRAKKLEVSDEKNRADLRLHLERILRGEVVENEVGAVADELTERSGGLFLWASFLPDTLRRLRRETGMERDTLLRRQDVVGEEWFPSGLSGMFRKYFARFRDEAMGGKDRYELVLAPIVAAREPLSKELVHAALGEPTMQATEQLIQKGRNLLYQTGSGGVGLLHKSMADWLTDADQDEDFHVDKEKGDALLAEVLLQREDDPFSVKHLVHHLVRCGRGEDAFARLNEFSWVRRVISQGEDQDQRRRAISALLRDCIELGIFDAEESETPRFLSKATSALSWDPRELASQVLGRLAKAGEVEHPLLQSLEVPTGGPWLRPVKTSLPHPRDPLLQVLQGPPTSYVHGAGVDGDMVVTASSDALVRVWSALSGELQQVLEGHTGEVTSVALQGELAVSGSQDKTVRLWNTRTGEPQSVLEGHTDFVTGVALQDGVVISGSKDKTVRLWNVATGALQHVFKGHKDEVMSVAVDGDCVISGSRDQTVRLWDAKTYKPKRVLKGHSSAVMGVAVQGDLVVSGSEDKSARVWSARTGSQQHVLEGHLFAVVSVAIQGDLVVTGSWDATVRVWEARTGQLQHELTGHSLEVTGVAIQGERVVSTSWDTTVRVWNAHPDGADYKLESHALSTEGVAVDGDTVVSGSLDQTVRVWNGATGALQHVLAGHTSYVYGVAVEGDVVVSGSDDSNVCLWDARSGELRHVLDDHTMCVKSVAISEGVVASGSWDKTVRLWDARSGELLRVLEGHEGWVVHVAMDGEYVLSGSMDSTVRLWRKRTGEQILKHRFSGPIAALELRAGALRVGYYDGSGGPRRDSWFVLSDPLSPTLREVQTLPDALLPSIEVENGTHLSIRGMPAKDGQRESGAGPVPSGSSVGFTTDNIIHRYTQQGDIVVIGELGGMVHILHVDRQ